MADNDKEAAGEGATPRGADWEVVTLTASAYAAAPGPGGAGDRPAAETKGLDASQEGDQTKGLDGSQEGRGSESALFMSGHFVFPPSEHENLPIDAGFDDIQHKKDAQEASTSVEDEGFKNVGGNYGAGLERIQFYDEGRNLSANDAAGEGATPRGADWEVVTLTASAYAAAPGPGGAGDRPAAETKGLDASQEGDQTKGLDGSQEGRGSESALFMSGHFVFPPSEHENLPIDAGFDDIQHKKDAQEASTSVEDEGFKNVGGNYGAGLERIQFYDEGRNLSANDVEMMMGDAAEHGSFHAQDEEQGLDDDNDFDDSHDKSDLPSESADSKSRDSGAPCKCWAEETYVMPVSPSQGNKCSLVCGGCSCSCRARNLGTLAQRQTAP
ncbi:hypothetical protein OsJ_13776 [Oryza sativa Japonica Group]|uniref:Uncharacterized protein n=1 Tax=Oryza sativa subsp. japonica TaxID=39947 RepID=A3AQX4_ORYSJ|nr:hypothetical protein OsJ_13776 [Oryza sativa Japonica Group]